jgi:hypothetical protein
MSESLEAQARALGIPMQIVIDNDTRYYNCDAHAASLAEITDNGKFAVYQGQCSNGHHYEVRRSIKELQSEMHIENGELVYGQGQSFDGGELEVY